MAQTAADVLNKHPQAGNPDLLIMATMSRATDRIQANLHLSDIEAFRLLNEMLKRYPDIGHSDSALEVLSACQDSGD